MLWSVMLCLGILSVVRVVPEFDNSLRHLVLEKW
jgi:hypothetical protein